MEHRNVIPVENETHSTCTRTTVDGRSITYSLTVLQQPARARACGQGAKSSADRRPVDPPPIVELTILLGEKPVSEDITFTMNANYFLFATLEQARPIAQGRVSQEKNTPPVMTGTPVSGIVYLDRPKPAGYFIFPDLSVRHEGKYRLSFSLYEELKSPKDHDKAHDGASLQANEDSHVTHRLDVRSEPFHVFSAKKFPGLTESTSLSRMVAEQGCRVRIRRDVRMRRREPKGSSKDWDEYEDETAAERAKHSATPDPTVYPMVQTPQAFMEQVPRPRSTSNASLGNSSFSRRPSVQDGSTYQQSQYATTSHTPQHSYPPAITPQYQSATFVQQPAPMQPPPPQYPTQSFQSAPSFPAPSQTQQTGYYNTASAPLPPPVTQQYAASQAFDSAPQPPRASTDYSSQPPQDYRRSSAQPVPPPPPPQGGYSQQTPTYSQSTSLAQHSYPPPPPPVPQQTSHQSIDLYSSNRPAPLEPLQPPARANGAHTPTSVKPSFDLPPINTAMMPGNSRLDGISPISSTGPQSSYFSSSTPTAQDTNKRSYGNVFSDRHQKGPLRQGARPSSFGQGESIFSGTTPSVAADDDNASSDFDPEMLLGMRYRRADGRQIRRALPGHA